MGWEKQEANLAQTNPTSHYDTEFLQVNRGKRSLASAPGEMPQSSGVVILSGRRGEVMQENKRHKRQGHGTSSCVRSGGRERLRTREKKEHSAGVGNTGSVPGVLTGSLGDLQSAESWGPRTLQCQIRRNLQTSCVAIKSSVYPLTL